MFIILLYHCFTVIVNVCVCVVRLLSDHKLFAYLLAYFMLLVRIA